MSKTFLDSFNLFSPPITLFYNKKKNHSRLPSFILTILGVLLLVYFTLYYFILMITRKNFTAYVYDSYLKIPPEIKGDKTGFFHYYTFYGKEPNDKYITMSGYDGDYNYEYIYGKCTEENMKGIENLIKDKEEFLNYGYCIKKSVRLSDGNINLVTDKNFVWPTIAEGRSVCYYLEINKCSNKTNSYTAEVKECASEEEINKYFENLQYGILNVLDNYVDVGLFKNPITSYFYKLNVILSSKTYKINHIIYNPVIINSHQNLITGKITKTNSIIFSRVDSAVGEKIEGQTEHTIAKIYIWRSFKVKIYERKYEGLLTFFTNIGGIYQIIMRICSLIDLFFSGYAELIDSKILYNDIKNIINKKEKSKNNIIINNRHQSVNLLNSNNYRYIIDKNQIASKKEFIHKSNIQIGMKNISINKLKNVDMDDKDIGFFKYLYYLFSGCFYYNKDIFQYLEIRKKVLSEEFLYQLYFEKYIENFKFCCAEDSKVNLITPDVENMNNFDIFQKINNP